MPNRQESEKKLISGPHEWWFSHFGRYLPGVTIHDEFNSALMRGYPHRSKPGVTRMGGTAAARFLISPEKAIGWSPIAPPEGDLIEMRPGSDRKPTDWIVDILMNPPPTPFLAASVGMSGADARFWRMTVSPEIIVFGGAAGLFDGEPLISIDRKRFLESRQWFQETKIPVIELRKFWELYAALRSGAINMAEATKRRDRLKWDGRVFSRYPGEKSSVVAGITSYAALSWEEGVLN